MRMLFSSLVLGSLLILAAARAETPPPFGGAIYVDPDIITDEDPTSFLRVESAGAGERGMFDRRAGNFVKMHAHLLMAFFDDGKTVEVQVNPEFSAEEALEQARRYLPTIGQLPAALRQDLKTLWIHKGDHSFGGGNRNFLIHTDRGDAFIKKGILAEAFLHEGCHTSLDAHHLRKPEWRAAQAKDPGFITKYAKQFPKGEDFAESFPLWFALRYKPDRIDGELKVLLEKTIPNRIAYFDRIDLDLHPVKAVGKQADGEREKKAE